MNDKVSNWTLMGLDTFDGGYYPIAGSYPSQQAAEDAAQARLEQLERDQPTKTSGGQFGGIQDRVFVIRPDGVRYRVFPTGQP